MRLGRGYPPKNWRKSNLREDPKGWNKASVSTKKSIGWELRASPATYSEEFEFPLPQERERRALEKTG